MSSFARIAPALAAGLVFASAAFAAEPVDPANTAWIGDAVIKAKVPGGSPAGTVTLEIDFDTTTFHLMANDGMEVFDVVGTFTTDAKGQPVLTVDTGALASELSDLMVHVCEDVLMLDQTICDEVASLDVVTDPSKIKLKVKTNATGPTLAFSGKIPFVLTDGNDSLKLAVSLKASPPLPPAN